jgi:hypothetical protein
LRRPNAPAAENLSATIASTVEQLDVEPTAQGAAGGKPSAPGRGMPARRLLPLERLFLGRRVGDTGRGRKAPSNPLKLLADKSGKSRSRVGFWHGKRPFNRDLWRRVLDIEVFDREWRPITSSDGVVCEVSVVRQRALRSQL